MLPQWFGGLCDILSRLDPEGYVAKVIRRHLLAYFDSSAFRGARILDFGCGQGTSTVCLAAMFPEAEVIGVELDPKRVETANRIVAGMGLTNARFLVSPDGESLPAGIGVFDFVSLSAVYEHLLPQERPRILQLIWAHMKPGGAMFLSQTPYRYFPFEHHTTGLWLINYLPDFLAGWLARHFSRINVEENRARDWKGLLRGGIRGATEREIVRNLARAGNGQPRIIQPKEGDRAAYWLACTTVGRHSGMKKMLAAFFRFTDKIFGTVPSTNLEVTIRKVS